MSLCIGAACIVGAALTHVDMGYSNSLPTVARSYDGRERDISRFYKDEQFNLRAQGVVIFENGAWVKLGIDNGTKTRKFQQGNAYTLGASYPFRWGQHSVTLQGERTWKGSISEQPCVETVNYTDEDDNDRSFTRDYFCGNLTAWKDWEGFKDEDIYSARITYRYKF